MATEQTLLDLEGMMEETLDDIPEAPDFVTPPEGEYNLLVKDAAIDKYKTKDEPDVEKQRLKITYSINQTISLSGKEPPVPDNSIFTETFQGTEQGVGYFKKRIKEIMNVQDTVGVKLSEMMASVKGCSFDARITIKKSPNPKGGEYTNVNLRVIPPKA